MATGDGGALGTVVAEDHMLDVVTVEVAISDNLHCREREKKN